MGSMQRARRAVVVGAFVVAAAAAPAYAVFSTPDAANDQAGGRCLAWLGSMADGQCIAYSNSNGAGSVNGGIPPVAIGGPNSGNPGLSTGPLFPGQTINVPLAPTG